MEKISIKKVLVSYLFTSMMILSISAIGNAVGIFGKGLGSNSPMVSVELVVVLQVAMVLVINSVLHALFYFGGFQSSPMAKGVAIGSVLGMTYFLVMVFGLGVYNINTDSFQMLFGAMTGKMLEYCTGGVMTAVLSVTEIHKWGMLRAF
jgi:hypothetical protein